MSHTTIVDEGSTDLDAVRAELRFELIVLHTEVKELNKGWDFSAIVNPLLEDQGDPIAVIARLNKQIERLKKLRDDFANSSHEGLSMQAIGRFSRLLALDRADNGRDKRHSMA